MSTDQPSRDTPQSVAPHVDVTNSSLAGPSGSTETPNEALSLAHGADGRDPTIPVAPSPSAAADSFWSLSNNPTPSAQESPGDGTMRPHPLVTTATTTNSAPPAVTALPNLTQIAEQHRQSLAAAAVIKKVDSIDPHRVVTEDERSCNPSPRAADAASRSSSRQKSTEGGGMFASSRPVEQQHGRSSVADLIQSWSSGLDNPKSMAENLEHFTSIAFLLVRLEKVLFWGAMGCLSDVLRAVGTPLRLFIPWTLTLRDVLSILIVACGVFGLCVVPQFDDLTQLYSTMYHIIRRQSALKIYVIYNICEVALRLLASFGTDALEAMWSATGRYEAETKYSVVAAGLADADDDPHSKSLSLAATSSAPDAKADDGSQHLPDQSFPPRGESPIVPTSAGVKHSSSSSSSSPSSSSSRRVSPLAFVLILGSVLLHTVFHVWVLLIQVVVINVAINASSSYALAALLISNNFVEVKGHVLKKNSPEQLFQKVLADVVERVDQLVFVLVILVRHILLEGYGAVDISEVMIIFAFEIVVDFVKHLFIARFNGLPLTLYSDFLVVVQWDCVRDAVHQRVISHRRKPISSKPSSAAAAAVASPPPLDPLVESIRRYLRCDRSVAASAASHWKKWVCAPLPGTFLSRRCRRSSFTPLPSASLLIWAALPSLASLWRSSPITCVVGAGCVMSLAALIDSTMLGLSLRKLTLLLLQAHADAKVASTAPLGPFGSSRNAAVLDSVCQYQTTHRWPK